MGKFLTGNKDLDSIILQNLTDRELVNVWLTGKYAYQIFNYDPFWRYRLKIKFPCFADHKDINMNFKSYYIYLVEEISKFTDGHIYDEISQTVLRSIPYKHNIFIWMCEKGYIGAIKYLLEGKNIFTYTRNSNPYLNITMLQIDEGLKRGSLNGHLDVVKYLVEKGADIHTTHDYPIQMASRYGHFEIVKYLVEKGGDKNMALSWASEKGNLITVKYLVENGADIHMDNEYCVRVASRNGYFDLVKYLVEKGANIHTLNDYALKWAKTNGHSEILKYLQELP